MSTSHTLLGNVTRLWEVNYHKRESKGIVAEEKSIGCDKAHLMKKVGLFKEVGLFNKGECTKKGSDSYGNIEYLRKGRIARERGTYGELLS